MVARKWAAGIRTTISKHHAARIESRDVSTERAMEELAAVAVSVAERLAMGSSRPRNREFAKAKLSQSGDRLSRLMANFAELARCDMR